MVRVPKNQPMADVSQGGKVNQPMAEVSQEKEGEQFTSPLMVVRLL